MPPTPINGKRPSVKSERRASTRVDFSNKGAPERPPVSRRLGAFQPVARERGIGGDNRVDAACKRDIGHILRVSDGCEVGGDLQEHGDRPRQPGARGDDAMEEACKRLLALKVAQAFSVLGEETLTVTKSTIRSAVGEDAREIGGAVDTVLVGAEVEAELAQSASRAARKAGGDRPPSPRLLKPKRLMTARSSLRRKRRGLGLPGCGARGCGAHFDEAEARTGKRR